jgi:dienelactone hydrolase
MRRALFGALVALLVALVAIALWRPARVAAETLVLLPALFPSAPVEPLDFITPRPSLEHQTFTYSGGTVEADVVSPSSGGQHAAVMLELGAGDLPESDLALRFADALARLGIVTMIPESSGMLAEHLTFAEVDAIRQSLLTLDARSDVDPTRVGIVGLSASGGISLVAAAQPDMRDRIRFVNSFGSYDDATTLLVDVASHTIDADGQIREWVPEERTVDVVDNALIDANVTDADRLELLAGTTRERATQITHGFSDDTRARLAAVSPSNVLNQIDADLYLMHDTDDPFIPFTESRQLVAQAPPELVKRYTEFSIFAHVIPDRPVPLQTFLPDVSRLFWHVQAVLLEVL